jgi:hypothetical protein
MRKEIPEDSLSRRRKMHEIDSICRFILPNQVVHRILNPLESVELNHKVKYLLLERIDEEEHELVLVLVLFTPKKGKIWRMFIDSREMTNIVVK